MNTANEHNANGAQISDANEQGEQAMETGRELRERLGVNERAFQAMWKRTLGYSFRANAICSEQEITTMEAKYPSKESGKKRVKIKRNFEADVVPVANVQPGNTIEPAKPKSYRKPVLLAALLIPTGASVTNTFMVSHALSNSQTTALLITGVASATSLLFLWAGVRSIGAWFVVAATLGFEAFCNAASIFKALLGSMAYSLTTVSGKPSEFLDMVANFTNRDHQDAGTTIAIFTAVMICGAQVSALYELKK